MLKDLQGRGNSSLALEIFKVFFELKVLLVVKEASGAGNLQINLSSSPVEVIIYKKKKSALVLKNKAGDDGSVVLLHIFSINSVGFKVVLVHLESVLLGPLLEIVNL